MCLHLIVDTILDLSEFQLFWGIWIPIKKNQYIWLFGTDLPYEFSKTTFEIKHAPTNMPHVPMDDMKVLHIIPQEPVTYKTVSQIPYFTHAQIHKHTHRHTQPCKFI